jgi:hypothetical protein
VTDGPRQTQPACLEQAPLPGGERRHRGQVVRLKGVTEPKQYSDAAEGENRGTHMV